MKIDKQTALDLVKILSHYSTFGDACLDLPVDSIIHDLENYVLGHDDDECDCDCDCCDCDDDDLEEEDEDDEDDVEDDDWEDEDEEDDLSDCEAYIQAHRLVCLPALNASDMMGRYRVTFRAPTKADFKEFGKDCVVVLEATFRDDPDAGDEFSVKYITRHGKNFVISTTDRPEDVVMYDVSKYSCQWLDELFAGTKYGVEA